VTSFDFGRRRVLALGAAAASTAIAPAAWAAAPYPALDRPVQAVRSPERTVLLSVTQAGRRIVAVGERGIIIFSDDHGVRWRQAASVPASVTLTSVRFVDAEHGWAVGHGGVILHSADGGEHWERQADGRTLARAVLRETSENGNPSQLRQAQQLVEDGPDKPLLDLHFFDRKRGIVVGAANLCFETRDGGRSWTSLVQRMNNPRALHLYGVRADGDTLHIVGEQGLMLRSFDGGQTFDRTHAPYDGSWFTLEVPRPGGIIVAGLRGNTFGSHDRGSTWAPVAGAPGASVVGSAMAANGALFLVTQSGQVLTQAAGGGSLRVLEGPPLPPLADVLQVGDGSLVTVGLAGIVRMPLGRSAAADATGGVR
jgi:photosystem II stability/assembly factor-like uncharacterized protein